MEKEISIKHDQLSVYFTYFDFNFSAAKIKKFNASLMLLAGPFQSFLTKNLGLNLPVTLYINLCDNEKIIELNSEYRDKPKKTDVLSFPLQENIRNDEYDRFLPEIELGDIYICDSVCNEQAKEFKISYEDEFLHLCVHGFLHLLGYDHEISEEENKLMQSFEKEILDEISISKGSN